MIHNLECLVSTPRRILDQRMQKTTTNIQVEFEIIAAIEGISTVQAVELADVTTKLGLIHLLVFVKVTCVTIL